MTTARSLYEAVLIELNKENAPNIILEDFNYFANKAINLYVNKRYNIYDINQQTTDDLRVLKATALLKPNKCDAYGNYDEIGRMMGATYQVLLPQDYLHILNCICIYKVNKTYKCYNKGDVWRCAARKLTADMYSLVLDNYWMRPTYKKPYYYIHNVNEEVDRIAVPTDPRRVGMFYLGTTRPTDSNYLSLLNEPTLNKSFDLGDIKLTWYVLYPNNGTFAMYDDEAHSREVLFGNAENFGSYIAKSSNGRPSGIVYCTSTGTAGSKREIGTDFHLGSLTDTYANREISESGISLDLGTDAFGNQIYNIVPGSGVRNTIDVKLGGDEYGEASAIERTAGVRYGNKSAVRMEIRYGSDDSLFTLNRVYIDYVKSPQHIRLTQEQIDLTEDTSLMLEFPDYVCQEIINELVTLIMENISDPKLQTFPVVNLSIANPAQQLTEPVAQLQPT